MSKVINEETQVKLDLKTRGGIAGAAISIESMYYILVDDTAEAKEKPEYTGSAKEIELRAKVRGTQNT